MGKGELSADLFAGKRHRCNRGDYNRDCRNEEKEVSSDCLEISGFSGKYIAFYLQLSKKRCTFALEINNKVWKIMEQ